MLTVEFCAMCGNVLNDSDELAEDEDSSDVISIEFSEFPVVKCLDCLDAAVVPRHEATCRL